MTNTRRASYKAKEAVLKEVEPKPLSYQISGSYCQTSVFYLKDFEDDFIIFSKNEKKDVLTYSVLTTYNPETGPWYVLTFQKVDPTEDDISKFVYNTRDFQIKRSEMFEEQEKALEFISVEEYKMMSQLNKPTTNDKKKKARQVKPKKKSMPSSKILISSEQLGRNHYKGFAKWKNFKMDIAGAYHKIDDKGLIQTGHFNLKSLNNKNKIDCASEDEAKKSYDHITKIYEGLIDRIIYSNLQRGDSIHDISNYSDIGLPDIDPLLHSHASIQNMIKGIKQGQFVSWDEYHLTIKKHERNIQQYLRYSVLEENIYYGLLCDDMLAAALVTDYDLTQAPSFKKRCAELIKVHGEVFKNTLLEVKPVKRSMSNNKNDNVPKKGKNSPYWLC